MIPWMIRKYKLFFLKKDIGNILKEQNQMRKTIAKMKNEGKKVTSDEFADKWNRLECSKQLKLVEYDKLKWGLE